MSHGVFVLLDLFQQALLLQQFHHLGAAGVAVHAVKFCSGLRVHHAMLVHHQDLGQVVAASDLKVVGIVGGSHLHAAGAELQINVIIGDHGNRPVREGQGDLAADDGCVALVFGIHGHSGVAQHGFRAGGGDDQVSLAVGKGIADVPELARLIGVFHLVVRQGGHAARAPVDNVFSLVDKTIIVEGDEDLFDRAGEHFIHGEAQAVPIAGCAKQFKLADDAVTLFLFPFPDQFHHGFAADLVAVFAFLGQFFFHHVLGGDSGMVNAGQPQGGLAEHAVEAHHHILQGVVEHVSHMQDAGHIGWRDKHGEGRFGGIARGLEIAALFPELIPFLFDLLCFVSFFDLHNLPHSPPSKRAQE